MTIFMNTEEIVNDLEKKRKQLLFRSWHRGTREMDLIMGSFADSNLSVFSGDELNTYDEILQMSDPDLYNWISGREPVPANITSSVMEKLIQYQFTA